MDYAQKNLLEMTLSGLNLIKQAISIYDADLKLRVANHRFQKMFNLPDETVVPGADFEATLYYLAEKGEYGEIDDIDAFVAEKVELARGFQPHYFERTRANGTLISVEGNPLSKGGWISVYTDITDVKREEQFIRSHAENLSEQLVRRSETLAETNRELQATVTALEAAKAELTASREQITLINEMMPAHIAHVDARGIYTHSNGKLHTILPHVGTQITGQTFNETLGPDFWAKVEPLFKNVLNGRSSVSELHDEASGRYIRLAMTPDMDGDNVIGCYMLSMDVTEEALARTALAHARRRELASQLTSGMTHDFSNLLTIIMGQQAKLDAFGAQNPDIRQISETINSAAKRGAELIESLSLIESPRTLNPVVVQVNDFIVNFERLAQAAVPEGIDFSLTSHLADDRLIFDPGFAQDAMLNLVLNASEAMDGSGAVRVTLTRAQDQSLEISVVDEGPGFSADALKNALAPFYTTKKNKLGCGLGLSASFDFAKSCGGKLRIGNQPGGGAFVVLKIPYLPAKSKEPGLVLLVDDDDEVRATVRTYLRQTGHTVVEAVSVQEASFLMNIEGLTQIVTDLDLGRSETGLDVVDIAPPDIPVLIITGLPKSDPLRQKAEQTQTVLSKPFQLAALENALCQVAAR
ncbi:PAS-domain containing protein [Marinovum sp. 2_MG-2023]|nr:PAS-domain containing protein [Marinovum sp. 2_MG-2023]MDO6781072.1 PAS-domain containing protein [Marinovum sp. 1_MG-2023]